MNALYIAAQNGTTVYLNGKECVIVRLKGGKVKVRRREGTKILESGWIEIERLRLSEHTERE